MIWKVFVIVGALCALHLGSGYGKLINNAEVSPNSVDLDANNAIGIQGNGKFSEAIEQASLDFSSNLAKFLHSDVGRKTHRKDDSTNIKLSDARYVLEDGSQITLEDVAIVELSSAEVDKIVPNLNKSNLAVSARWQKVALIASYSKSKSLDSFSKQNLVIVMEDIKANGKVGMAVTGLVPQVSNFELTFSMRSVIFKNVSSDGQIQYLDDFEGEVGIVNIFNEYFERDIRQILKENLRNVLDAILKDFPFKGIFKGDKYITKRYKSLVIQRDAAVDQLVDLVLTIFRTYLQDHNMEKITIPDIHTTFEEKIFGVPVKGTFVANKGKAGDMTTVHRTRSFSLDGNLEIGDFTLFGSLGFSKLYAFYNYFKIDILSFHPSGSFSAAVGSNSIYFQITANLKDDKVLEVKSYDLKVEKLGGIEVSASGMGSGLDWIVSKAVSWVANHFKTKIIQSLEMKAKEIINKKLDEIDWKISINKKQM